MMPQSSRPVPRRNVLRMFSFRIAVSSMSTAVLFSRTVYLRAKISPSTPQQNINLAPDGYFGKVILVAYCCLRHTLTFGAGEQRPYAPRCRRILHHLRQSSSPLYRTLSAAPRWSPSYRLACWPRRIGRSPLRRDRDCHCCRCLCRRRCRCCCCCWFGRRARCGFVVQMCGEILLPTMTIAMTMPLALLVVVRGVSSDRDFHHCYYGVNS